MTEQSDLAGDWDVAVIGAGPAGMAAAAVAARAGARAILLDDNAGPGGQIYRAISATPLQDRRVLGADYWHGTSLVGELASSGARHVARATVWSLDRSLELAVSVAGRSTMIRPKRVILATGALERPFPIPGWTLPGVMTAGAAQTLLKTSGLVPDQRVVLAGCGPLLWLLASQILRAGGRIQAILDTTSRDNWRRALPEAVSFATTPYLRKGLALMAAVRRQARVISGITALAAVGPDRLERVAFSGGDRRTDHMPADVLLLHQGVAPNVNLAMAARVEHRWNDVRLAWEPVLDADGRSSVDGILIAGDGAGIAGARAAEERGRLAAIRAVRDLGLPGAGRLPDDAAIRGRLAAAERGRAFLDALYRPAKAFRVPAPATIVCRCEEVTAAQVREVVAQGCQGPNQAKAYLRCGMGPCQGRLCGLTVTELIADARGLPPSEIGYYRLRPPVKPVTLAEFAAMDKPESAVNAVVRT